MTKQKAVDFGIKNNQTTQNYECLTTTQKDKICKRCGYTRKDTIKEVREKLETARRCLRFQQFDCGNEECKNYYCILNKKFWVKP